MTLPELRDRLRAPAGPVLDIHFHVATNMGLKGKEPIEVETRTLLASAERSGVTHLSLLALGYSRPFRPTPLQCREANDLALRAREVAPDRLLPFCYLNPEFVEESVEEMYRCIEQHRMVAVKLWIAAPASDPRVIAVVTAAAQLGVPVLQHAWNKVTGNIDGESTAEDVAKLARAVPEAKIIMAHLVGWGARGLERVTACPNVSIDTSGGECEAGLVKLACERLGYQRVLYGSDGASRHFGSQLSKVVAADIPDEQKRAILWDNAVRLMPRWAPVHAQEEVVPA